jgi:hypothetical protein
MFGRFFTALTFVEFHEILHGLLFFRGNFCRFGSAAAQNLLGK